MNGPQPLHPLLHRDALDKAILICRMDLEVIQGRLGTAAERPGDVDRASEIVHRINNLTAALGEAH